MKIYALLLAFVLVSAGARAQDAPEAHPNLFHAAIAGCMALHGSDAMLTAYLLGSQRNTVREANPVLAPFAGNPAAFGAVKLGIAALGNLVIIKTHRNHRWLAVGILAAEIAVEGYAVVHNQRLLRQMR